MKRIVTILCVCLLVLTLLCACGANGDTSSTEDGAYLPIKDQSGNITGYERKYHNDDGDITRWDVYTADEVYDHYILYEYNSDGLLGQETYYRADGIGVYYYAYSYYDDGTLAEKDYVSVKEGSSRTLYDENGTETERYTFDNDDNLIKYEVFENDAWTEAQPPTAAPEATE